VTDEPTIFVARRGAWFAPTFSSASGCLDCRTGVGPCAVCRRSSSVWRETAAVIRLSEHVSVYRGPIQVGIVRDGQRALLIDCGDGSVSQVLPELGIQSVDQILFTHHHRDQACGAYPLAASGSQIGVPVGEKDHFANPADYWNDDAHLWRVYRSFRPHPLMLTEPLRVDQTLAEGQEIRFGAAKIQVISTPGHTDGSISFVVDADGQRVSSAAT
jgi:glyoxylase-like metal-dependent hydrolase (beta-lactamase superfamily II)